MAKRKRKAQQTPEQVYAAELQQSMDDDSADWNEEPVSAEWYGDPSEYLKFHD